jgi:hypothetical protein
LSAEIDTWEIKWRQWLRLSYKKPLSKMLSGREQHRDVKVFPTIRELSPSPLSRCKKMGMELDPESPENFHTSTQLSDR